MGGEKKMFSSKPKDTRTFTGTIPELWQSIVSDVRTEPYYVLVIRPRETEPYAKLRVNNIGVCYTCGGYIASRDAGRYI